MLATLNADGRTCPARPLAGSAIGSASGLVALARSEQELRQAVAWMPGRILVLSGTAVSRRCLRMLLSTTELSTFAGIVALVGEGIALGPLATATARIPMVAVSREPDQERVRRAVRVGLEVAPEHDLVTLPVPAPRIGRPRRGLVVVASSSGVPGTIDVRAAAGDAQDARPT